mmetsp:Transcript_17024/g.39341  ORF Transcript_17024/g.39341 Transcript_17024/m.39341 type:complete len:369 (-) Transcript_17024:136-1242(-)
MPSTFIATSNKKLVPNLQHIQLQSDANGPLFSTIAFNSIYKQGPDDNEQEENVLVRGSLNPGLAFARKGLSTTIVDAYNRHLHLELRPDDVWITILAQFSAFVNGRAEQLRDKFVSHEGKKELVVTAMGNIMTADFGDMTRCMLDEITRNIKDPDLREWFLPGFSTSTGVDDICAAAASMCTLQAYFDYKFTLMCGIPQVTLLGNTEDWKRLRNKIERLVEFETADGVLKPWVSLLRRVCDNFVESSETGSEHNLDFWDTVAHHHGGGSGPSYLSGWVTVFSYFDNEGQVTKTTDEPRYNDGIWPAINSNDLNPNVVSCPMLIDDNGVEYDGRLFVGQMAYEMEKQESTATLKPRNDWALAITPKKME